MDWSSSIVVGTFVGTTAGVSVGIKEYLSTLILNGDLDGRVELGAIKKSATSNVGIIVGLELGEPIVGISVGWFEGGNILKSPVSN